jgi:glycosyl-4,4'-diaponeurosporenoate acyltransferase
MIPLIVTVNVLGWPVIHVVLAWLFIRLPDECFAEDSWLTRQRDIERSGLHYRTTFAVQRMKRLLPDGAPWLGGRSKTKIKGRNSAELNTFMLETRRAEVAHWCMLLCTPAFYFWNPRWACLVMTVYGIAANIPCILAQRANRIKIMRILQDSSFRNDRIPGRRQVGGKRI